jgi:hypothetical protein
MRLAPPTENPKGSIARMVNLARCDAPAGLVEITFDPRRTLAQGPPSRMLPDGGRTMVTNIARMVNRHPKLVQRASDAEPLCLCPSVDGRPGH